jgi:hypothetical protein
MKRTTHVNYLDEWGNVIATMTRCRNVPVTSDYVVLHTTEEDVAVNATYEVSKREWVADGSGVNITLDRVTPFRITDPVDEE